MRYSVMQTITRYHLIIVLSFILLTAGLAYPAILYFSATTLDVDPPKGSPSAESLAIIREVYPNITQEQPYVILIDDPSNTRYSASNPICGTDEDVLSALKEFTTKVNAIASENEYYIVEYDYFRAMDEFQLAKDQFCMNASFLIQILFDIEYDDIKTAPVLSGRFNAEFRSTFAQFPFLQLFEINEGLLSDDSSSGTAQDLLKLDTISITCGLIIVGLYLRSFKFLIISLLNLIISFVVSFAISYFISFGISIATFAPPVQSSALVALTFDYCLFLFSRLQSELKNGKSGYEAVESMLSYSGHVVIVSGGCLSLVFMFLLICPVELIQSIGLASAISICVLMLVNTVNTAAVLMLFPRFFMKSDYPFGGLDVILKEFKKWKSLEETGEDAGFLPGAAPNTADETADVKTTTKASELEQVQEVAFKDRVTSKASQVIYKILDYITSRVWMMLLLLAAVFALSLAFLPAFLKMHYSMDLTAAMPRNSATVKGMNRLADVSAPGIMTPFYIVLNKTEPSKVDTLLNDEVFNHTQRFIQKMIDNSAEYFADEGIPELILNSDEIVAPCFVGEPMSSQEIKLGRTLNLGSVLFLLNQTAPYAEDLSTFALMVTPNISMSGKHSEIFVPWIRSEIVDSRADFDKIGVRVSEYSKQTTLTDSVFGLFDSFPAIIGVSFAVMFLILGFTFRSILSPLCFLVEVGLAMVFFYGVATHLFEFDQINGNDGLFWATILIMFSIAIGLCSDYYVFRFSGIYNEFAEAGNARQAVMDASENMSVVMTAGLIMIVSFSGLLFSSLDMLLQFGVCLVVSLAFDTLFVVPVLVPSITVLCGRAMFWPGRCWPKTKSSNAEAGATDVIEELGVLGSGETLV